MIKLSFSFIFSLFAITMIGQKTSVNLVRPELVGMSSDRLEAMDTHFHEMVDNKQLAGIQTAIMRKGSLIHFDSYGYANIDELKTIDENTIFRIFSMTKPLVSIALMKLYEEGKFELDDPVHKFIPEFEQMYVYKDSTTLVPVNEPIKVIDLLRHSSGFGNGRSPYPKLDQMYSQAGLLASQTNKEIVGRLSKLPLLFEPGTDWKYGYSTVICGYLIEVLSGKNLDAFLKEQFFLPLNMKDTHFQLPSEKIERFTVGYRWHKENGLIASESQRVNRFVNDVTLFNGGGGLVSTSKDYLRFCQMLLNKGRLDGNRILREETIDLILTDHLTEIRKHQELINLPEGEAGFGLGFAIRGNNEAGLEKVYGWGGSVGTFFKIDFNNDLIYILMIQLYPHRQLGLRQLFQDYVQASIIE